MDVAKRLIERGANIDAKGNSNETALHAAVDKGNFYKFSCKHFVIHTSIL